MDVLVVAGEASGDQHAAAAVAALKKLRPELRFFGMGGPRLAAQGVELIHGAHEISVMGIVEVIPQIPRIWRVLKDVVQAVQHRKPAVALLVDVPDFNLRLAKRLKALGIPVVYYVAPMAWAWRENRTKIIAQRVDRLLCILPFEEDFFRARGVNATYVGNPVVEQLPPIAPASHFRKELGLPAQTPLLAVLPGSRRSEITRMSPTLASVCARIAKERPGTGFVIPLAPGLSLDAVQSPFLKAGITPTVISGRAPEVVGACDVALVASGTATLEAGLMLRPLVAVYRVNPLSYAVGKMLVRIPFFCLVNLLANKKIVPELLQSEMTCERVVKAIEPLWAGTEREACVKELQQLRQTLGNLSASAHVAQTLMQFL